MEQTLAAGERKVRAAIQDAYAHYVELPDKVWLRNLNTPWECDAYVSSKSPHDPI